MSNRRISLSESLDAFTKLSELFEIICLDEIDPVSAEFKERGSSRPDPWIGVQRW